MRCERCNNWVSLCRGNVAAIVPMHRELKVGTLSGVLEQSGVIADEFILALR